MPAHTGARLDSPGARARVGLDPFLDQSPAVRSRAALRACLFPCSGAGFRFRLLHARMACFDLLQCFFG